MHLSPKYIFRWSALVALFFTFIANENLHAQFRDEIKLAPLPAGKISINEFNFFDGNSFAPEQNIPGLQDQTAITPSHKSPFLAGLLSFILPGLGEYYVGDHIWRGVIFTALDAILLYEHFRYIARQNDSLTAFYNYGYANFSPVLYADSLNSRLALFPNRTNFRIDTNKVKLHDFTDINKAEDSLEIFGVPDMSHRLQPYGSWDYQEIISKYDQFVFGWVDYFAGGPKYSPAYEEHAFMEADANHQADIASYFIWGMLLNRVLSVIDAVILAHDHNTPIHLEGELRQYRYPSGAYGFIPTANIRYTF